MSDPTDTMHDMNDNSPLQQPLPDDEWNAFIQQYFSKHGRQGQPDTQPDDAFTAEALQSIYTPEELKQFMLPSLESQLRSFLSEGLTPRQQSRRNAMLWKFMTWNRHLAPYNALLVRAQRPQCLVAYNPLEWLARGRIVSPNCTGLLILKIGGPVGMVFDYLDTVADARQVGRKVLWTPDCLLTPPDNDPQKTYKNGLDKAHFFTAKVDEATMPGNQRYRIDIHSGPNYFSHNKKRITMFERPFHILIKRDLTINDKIVALATAYSEILHGHLPNPCPFRDSSPFYNAQPFNNALVMTPQGEEVYASPIWTDEVARKRNADLIDATNEWCGLLIGQRLGITDQSPSLLEQYLAKTDRVAPLPNGFDLVKIARNSRLIEHAFTGRSVDYNHHRQLAPFVYREDTNSAAGRILVQKMEAEQSGGQLHFGF